MYQISSKAITLGPTGCFVISINHTPAYGPARDFKPSPRDHHSRQILLRALDYGNAFREDHLERIAQSTKNADLEDSYIDLIIGTKTSRYVTMIRVSPSAVRIFLRYPGCDEDEVITIRNDHYHPYTLRVKLSEPLRFPFQRTLFGYLFCRYTTYDITLSSPYSDHGIPIPTVYIESRRRKISTRATLRHTPSGEVEVHLVTFSPSPAS